MKNKIKTFEDAAKSLGLDPNDLPEVSKLPEEQREALVAQYKLWVICQALNEGWKPDWKNGQWDKYYPWFYIGSSGSGFSFDVCDNDYDISVVGSRLAYKSSELAEYAGKQFEELYKTVFVLK